VAHAIPVARLIVRVVISTTVPILAIRVATQAVRSVPDQLVESMIVLADD
jgi:hypothetical protein